jgi:hypothetical protein
MLFAEYLDSKSCAECHDSIHSEHITSMHANSSLFKDDFHKKMKMLNYPDTYKCAVCHIPGAKDLDKIISGQIQPSHTTRQLDGVSCLYCHQITNIKKSHIQNENVTTFGRNGKQMLYGALVNPGESDKHDSVTIHPKYNVFKTSKVCMGCHSHKRNESHDVEVCKISIDEKIQTDCIKCHMPKYRGGITKINKKGREEYASHQFLGIKDNAMIKQAVKLTLSQNGHIIELTIENKMGHQILLQPMRLKYVQTIITRDGNTIWKNFKDSPYEDKEVTFSKLFGDKDGNQVYPPKAENIKYYTNLDTYKNKTVSYKINNLQKGDIVTSTWISYPIRPSLAKELDITDLAMTKKYIGTTTSIEIK